MVLDVDHGRTANGTLIFPWPINGAVNQQWYDHPASGTIRSRLGPNLCMDIIGKICFFRIRLCYAIFYFAAAAAAAEDDDNHRKNAPCSALIILKSF